MTLITLALFVASIQYLWTKDWGLTICIVASVVFHEFGHAVLLMKYGFRIGMIFIPFLGAAVTMNSKDAKKLSFGQEALVAIAGPFVNVLLVFVGLSMLFQPELHKYGLALVGMNLTLAYFNLLPFTPFDGGKFVKATFESLNEEDDQVTASILGAVALLFGFVMVFLHGLNLPLLLVYVGIRKKLGEDDPRNAYSPKAMSRKLATRLLVLYTVILFGSLIASVFVPNWIELFHIWPSK